MRREEQRREYKIRAESRREKKQIIIMNRRNSTRHITIMSQTMRRDKKKIPEQKNTRADTSNTYPRRAEQTMQQTHTRIRNMENMG